MKTMTRDVLEFRNKIRLPVSPRPRLLEPNELTFHTRFIMEELSELLSSHEQRNLVDAADAVADLLYVILGMSLHMGLDLDQIFKLVHEANMQKQPGSTVRSNGMPDAIKPPGWVDPKIRIAQLLKSSV